MSSKRVAVIGAGVSGLSIGRMLREAGHDATIFEKDPRPGGLIKCTVEDGNLYHRVGGHVFNSRRQDVLDWFWNLFDKDADFIAARRNSAIALGDGNIIGAPVEDHIHQMDPAIQAAIVQDLLDLAANPPEPADNFDDFLRRTFGETLYRIYFGPYNRKIWRTSLKDVPLAWLEGKLPTPSVSEILLSNITRKSDSNFVHSTFFYPKQGGSQFIADTLAKGLPIVKNSEISRIGYEDGRWLVNGTDFDRVVYTGNLKALPGMLSDTSIELDVAAIDSLESHGTLTVLCEIDRNPFSWIYLPTPEHDSHRIICTGNFSQNNNAADFLTATVEFSTPMDKEEILENLSKLPFHPRYIAHHYEKYTYPMQTRDTPLIVAAAKEVLEPRGLHLVGRFAEWQYYNMDAAIAASMDLMSGSMV